MSRFLDFLVRLLPSEFRDQFGDEIREHIALDREHLARHGSLRLWIGTLATAWDLLRTAALERIAPSWIEPGIGRRTTLSNTLENMMNGWGRDLRWAFRTLRRSPGFTAVAVATLALAIGANAGIFSVVDTVLLDALPYEDSERLIAIRGSAPGSDFPEEFGVANEFYLQYGEQATMLESVATHNGGTASLRVADRVERIPMIWGTPDLFSTLGVAPVLGRLPEAQEENVTVISHTLWENWFGADPAVIGTTHQISGASRTIIGVMGPDFWFPTSQTLLWNSVPTLTVEEPGRFGRNMVARTTPDADRDALAAELRQLALRLPERYGGSANYGRLMEQFRPVVRSLDEQLVGSVSGVLWVLLGAAGAVLLIACANLANLFLVRAEGRQRALALRRALGAARGTLLRAQMAEVTVVAALAGVLAVLLARTVVPVFVRIAPAEVPRIDQVGIDAGTLWFTAGVTVLAALLCGILPALRSSNPQLERLREAGRGSTRARHWGGNALVVVQTALALVLLIGSGLLGRSFWELRNVDPGYETRDIFSFQYAPERDDLVTGEDWALFHQTFMERLRALPGVESVGIVENLPLNEGVSSLRMVTNDMAEEDAALLYYTFSGGDYFPSMGIQVLRGRTFEPSDQRAGANNIVISEAAARLIWPNGDAVGQQLRSREGDTWYTVVGVVEDVMQYSFRDVPDPLIYLPLVGPEADNWALSSPAYVIKTPRADVIASEVHALVREHAPSAPMYRVYTMEQLASDSMAQLSFSMLTLAIASGLALILGALGLYGVLSYVVAQRTQEIGVRMALGAEARRVRRMVVVDGIRVVAVGVVLGVVVALASTRVLGSLLYEVAAVDVTTFAAMSVAMIAVGWTASYLPARRASGVDPMEALRSE